MQTPYFIVRPEVAAKQFDKISKQFKRYYPKVYYVLKSNPSKSIISVLKRKKAYFEISSIEELSKLGKYDKKKIAFYNPSFNEHDFKLLVDLGYTLFTLDSEEQANELLKIKTQGMRIYFRYRPDVAIGRELYPNRTLGMTKKQIMKCVLSNKYVAQLEKVGLHMHLSSQNTDLKSWKFGVRSIVDLAMELRNLGVNVTTINLGGGYPIRYNTTVPNISQIYEAIRRDLDRLALVGIKLKLEPGRFISGPTTELHTTVKLVKGNVLYIDDSTYTSYLDSILANVFLPIKTKKGNAVKDYTIRGKSPDSLDIFRKAKLPLMKKGDKIIFLNAGSYILGTDFLSYKPIRRIEK